MRPRERSRGQTLDQLLIKFSEEKYPLPGAKSAVNRGALVEQIIESIRRVEYIAAIEKRSISPLRGDPSSDLFDPIKAAILHKRQGNIDEACWLVFVSVHFGKNHRTGWRLARDVYGALGKGDRWTWEKVAEDPRRFRDWLGENQSVLRGSDGVARHFGNHRKRQSLDAFAPSGTGAAVESYVSWIHPPRTHAMLFAEAATLGDARKAFEHLYESIDAVISFGRLAKFDYLTMIGKLQLAQIEPGSAYMEGSTGPLEGARVLFGGSRTAKGLDLHALDSRAIELGASLNIGMQVVEDALCNWQKSPGRFRAFRG